MILSPSRLALLVMLLCGSAWAKPSAEATRQARAHFKVAQAAYDTGNFPKAVDEYLAAWQAAPLPAFLFNVAQAYRQSGDVKHALEYYRRYLEEEPDAAPSDEARKNILALTRKLEAETPPPVPPPSPEPVVAPPPPVRPAVDPEEVRRVLRKQIEDEKLALGDKERREQQRDLILSRRRTGLTLLGVGVGLTVVGGVLLGVGLRPCGGCTDGVGELAFGSLIGAAGVGLLVSGGAVYGIYARKPLP